MASAIVRPFTGITSINRVSNSWGILLGCLAEGQPVEDVDVFSSPHPVFTAWKIIFSFLRVAG
jgi:hypothetical protein